MKLSNLFKRKEKARSQSVRESDVSFLEDGQKSGKKKKHGLLSFPSKNSPMVMPAGYYRGLMRHLLMWSFFLGCKAFFCRKYFWNGCSSNCWSVVVPQKWGPPSTWVHDYRLHAFASMIYAQASCDCLDNPESICPNMEWSSRKLPNVGSFFNFCYVIMMNWLLFVGHMMYKCIIIIIMTKLMQ